MRVRQLPAQRAPAPARHRGPETETGHVQTGHALQASQTPECVRSGSPWEPFYSTLPAVQPLAAPQQASLMPACTAALCCALQDERSHVDWLCECAHMLCSATCPSRTEALQIDAGSSVRRRWWIMQQAAGDTSARLPSWCHPARAARQALQPGCPVGRPHLPQAPDASLQQRIVHALGRGQVAELCQAAEAHTGGRDGPALLDLQARPAHAAAEAPQAPASHRQGWPCAQERLAPLCSQEHVSWCAGLLTTCSLILALWPGEGG